MKKTCPNCATITAGEYCRHCGQRLDTHVHSLWHFLSEAVEVLTHADSRVWNTLRYLVTRPGFLTREYFAGRRARYLEPFRLYLIMGVLFLLVAARLAGHGTVPLEVQASPPAVKTGQVDACIRLSPGIQAACRRIQADSGRELGERVVKNVGRAMFIFLPLLAGFMKLLYWRPRRYFLEHLVLLLHNHAFVYLWLSLSIVASRWLSSRGWGLLLIAAMALYLNRYLYCSLKVAYGQSAGLTMPKFAVLALAYVVAALLMLLLTALFSAVTL